MRSLSSRTALALVIALSAAGCDDGTTNSNTGDDTTTTTEVDAATDMTAEDIQDEAPASLAVSNLLAVQNPANTLSFYVSWSTSAETPTELEVDCGADYQHTFSDTIGKSDHEVFVMGLLDGSACDFKVHGSLPEITGEVEIRVEDIGGLPESLPELTVNQIDEARMEPGWTAFSLARAYEPQDMIVVLIDPQGRYRWYYEVGTSYSGAGAELQLYDGGLLIGNAIERSQIASWEGRALWTIDKNVHHDMQPSPWNDGHILYLGYSRENCDFNEHTIVEMNMETREIIWEWRICDHWTPRNIFGEVHWSHLNTIEPVPGERAVLISARDQDLVFKINRDTDEIEWALGINGDFEMTKDQYFLRQHAPEIQPDDTILILDNGLRPDEAVRTGLDETYAREYTRVLQYQLNFTEEGAPKDVSIVWEYTDESIFAHNRSEADRLPNGNTLIHYVWVQPDETLIMREVTEEKEIVWDVSTPPGVSSYRSQRIPPQYGYILY